jgi:hypothetical protein
VKSDDVRVYAVWVPILLSDSYFTVPRATNRLPDPRVSHYWDGNGKLVRGYAQVLKLDEGKPAWDVYFVFDRDAEWREGVPAPEYWMHQIDLAPERTFDGHKLADEVERLLQQKRN